MTVHRSTVWMLIGVLSALAVASTWVVSLAPVKWNLRYPGGIYSFAAALGVPIVLSFFSGKYSSRWWYLLSAFAIVTLVCLGFIHREAMWF